MEPWLLIGEIVVCARVTIPNRMEHVKKVRRLTLISFPWRSRSIFNAAVPSPSTLCVLQPEYMGRLLILDLESGFEH